MSQKEKVVLLVLKTCTFGFGDYKSEYRIPSGLFFNVSRAICLICSVIEMLFAISCFSCVVLQLVQHIIYDTKLNKCFDYCDFCHDIGFLLYNVKLHFKLCDRLQWVVAYHLARKVVPAKLHIFGINSHLQLHGFARADDSAFA